MKYISHRKATKKEKKKFHCCYMQNHIDRCMKPCDLLITIESDNGLYIDWFYCKAHGNTLIKLLKKEEINHEKNALYHKI